jgi:hypothetical protein
MFDSLLAVPVNIVFVPALAVGVWVATKLALRARAWRKHVLSQHWPMVAGFFQSATVSALRTGYMGEGVKFRLSVGFSYRIGDLEHPGVYVHDFGTEEDALGLARSLEKGPLYVRYDPGSPSRYVIDPYRDVWVSEGQKAPHAGSEVVQALAPVRDTWRGRVNSLTNPISIGQLVIFQLCAAIFFYCTSTRTVGVFWFLAAGHALGAVMTTGCYWWKPTGSTLPTWIGRLALAVIACMWVLVAQFLK